MKKGYLLLTLFCMLGSSCKNNEVKYENEYDMVIDVLNNYLDKYKSLDYIQYSKTTTTENKNGKINSESENYHYDKKNNIIYYFVIRNDKLTFESYHAYQEGIYYKINKTSKYYKIFDGYEGELNWNKYDLYFQMDKSDKVVVDHLMNNEDYSSFDFDISKIGYIKSNGVKTVSKTTYESTYTIEDYILKDYKLITTSEYSVSIEQVSLETNRIDLSLPSINGYKDVTLEDNILWS